MLRNIVIQNLALADKVELEFDNGLNILSGETGAGKSIIVDAIMLLLGGKYDKTLLRFGQSFGFVEGVFDVTSAASSILIDMGHEADDIVIITRKFYESGKNEVRINGRTTTISMLKTVTEKLVDIYGQHEYLSISKVSEQNRLFDYYIRNHIEDTQNKLKQKVLEYHEVINKLQSIGTSDDRERTIDILQYQIEEINKAAVKEGEDIELSEKRKIIASAEKINNALSAAINTLSEDEFNVISCLCQTESELLSIKNINDSYAELAERISDIRSEVEDVAELIKDELNMDFKDEDIDSIEERLDLLRSLKRKYGDYKKMMSFYSEANEKLYMLQNSDKIYAKLLKDKQNLIDEIYKLSLSLSQIRQQFAKDFEKEIERHLSELGMETVKFKVYFSPFPTREDCEDHISFSGMDSFELYFSPNCGQPLQPMIKTISGGELSRFMLALKVVNGEQDEIPTMIFDEIDTGISGNIGRAVAQKLASLSYEHQVLCVTHLPQIAAMATNQYYIEKKVEDGQTYTKAIRLDRSGMIKEIARLSGGYGVSAGSELAAAELKEWADKYKISLNK